jgi:hypothetical protein
VRHAVLLKERALLVIKMQENSTLTSKFNPIIVEDYLLNEYVSLFHLQNVGRKSGEEFVLPDQGFPTSPHLSLLF